MLCPPVPNDTKFLNVELMYVRKSLEFECLLTAANICCRGMETRDFPQEHLCTLYFSWALSNIEAPGEGLGCWN